MEDRNYRFGVIMWGSSSLYGCVAEFLAKRAGSVFSLDLSTTNIILTVAVVGLLALFILLLVKLNPTKEDRESFETAAEVEKPVSRETLPVIRQRAPDVPPPRIEVQRPAEKQTVMERPMIAVSPTPSGSSMQTSQETKTPTTSYAKELARQAEQSARPNRFGNASNRKDCIHHFGYLRTFPKNSPIPDECFGCEKIVDCLVAKNHGKEKR